MKLARATLLLAILFATPSASAQNSDQNEPAAQSPRVIFVSAQDGDDSWSGAVDQPNSAGADGPLKTLHAARLKVQEIKQKSNAGQANAHAPEIDVKMKAGTYYLTSTEIYGAADSGSEGSEIVYENDGTGQVVISAGAPITSWKRMFKTPYIALWSGLVPPLYFEDLFFNGVRQHRPRLALTATDYPLGTYLRFASNNPVYVADDKGANATCVRQTDPPPPAGTPYLCLDRFRYTGSVITSTWANLTAPSSPPTKTCAGNPGSQAPVGDIELVDFEKYSAAKLRVACVDETNHMVYLTGPASFESNHQTTNGFLPEHRFLIDNIQSYFVSPPQWFLVRPTSSPWTLYYASVPGKGPKRATVVAPQLSQIMIASDLQYVTFRGLTFSHANYVVPDAGFDGLQPIPAALSIQNSSHITFDTDAFSNMSGAALEFISCLKDTKASKPYPCQSFDKHAVTASNVIENSAFYDLGAGAIRIGMSAQAEDTTDNIPNNTQVINNVIEGYGRTFPDSKAIEQGDGHHNIYTHNEIYDGYKSAIHVCYCSDTSFDNEAPLASNNTISYNLVHDLFQGIMNDTGSLYFGVGTPNSVKDYKYYGKPATATGNILQHNIVHDVNDASAIGDKDGYGGDGLYLDDFTGSVDVEYNLVYRVSDNAMSFSGPRSPVNGSSKVNNNIFAYARRGMLNAYDPYAFKAAKPSPLFFDATNNIFYFDRNETSSPAFYVQGGCAWDGASAGEAVKGYVAFQNWANNLYYRADGMFAGDNQAFRVQLQADSKEKDDCPDGVVTNPPGLFAFYPFAGMSKVQSWQHTVGEDANSVIDDPGFTSPGFPKDDYTFTSGSPLPGFVPFLPETAGRTSTTLMPPTVAPTFETATFSKTTGF